MKKIFSLIVALVFVAAAFAQTPATLTIDKGDNVTTVITENGAYVKIGNSVAGLPALPYPYTDFASENGPVSVTPVLVLSYTTEHNTEIKVCPEQGFLVGSDGSFYAWKVTQ